MSTNTFPYGFRIVGPCSGDRRLVDWTSAFRAYGSCDKRARVDSEAYLSAFTFGADFASYLRETGSTKGYAGSCFSDWLWFDLDNEDLAVALDHARRLIGHVTENLQVADDTTLVFFSGSKGFHVGLPTAAWQPEPSATFHKTARTMAESIADAANVTIDTSIYDRVRAFRAPNSAHPRTGLHKRRLTVEELLTLSPEGIRQLAEDPDPFDPPQVGAEAFSWSAARAWTDAGKRVEQQQNVRQERRAANSGPSLLNRETMAFIRDGASNGERADRLFKASANLAEYGCPPALVHALLTESALDSGLTPQEVRRQIECGIEKGGAS